MMPLITRRTNLPSLITMSSLSSNLAGEKWKIKFVKMFVKMPLQMIWQFLLEVGINHRIRHRKINPADRAMISIYLIQRSIQF